jgi:hypothetical protein
MEPYARENAHQPGLDGLAFDFALGVCFAHRLISDALSIRRKEEEETGQNCDPHATIHFGGPVNDCGQYDRFA